MMERFQLHGLRRATLNLLKPREARLASAATFMAFAQCHGRFNLSGDADNGTDRRLLPASVDERNTNAHGSDSPLTR
jgi:hypothetical protein